MEERTVRVGDRDLPIVRFRGLKAVLAGALMARVMREMPEIQERINSFIKDFRAKNTVTVTPAMAKLPSFSYLGLTPEDFEAGGGTVELPDEPGGQQVLFAVMPEVFEFARKEFMRFLAIIVIPNSELETADDADEVDTALDRWGKTLLRSGDIDELLELLVVGWEVMEDQILRKKDKLGKLTKLPFVQTLLSMGQTSTLETASESEEQEEATTEQTSSPDAPSLFTDSDISTDGTDEQPSMASLGTSS